MDIKKINIPYKLRNKRDTVSTIPTGAVPFKSVSNVPYLGGFPAADYLRRNIEELITENFTFETAAGLINISPTGWRTAVRAAFRILTKTDNPAELDLTHTEGEDLKGWQISARASADGGVLNIYSNTNSAYNLQFSIDKLGNITPTGRYRISDKWSFGFNSSNNDLEFYGSDGNKKAMVDQNGNLYAVNDIISNSTR